MKPGPKQVWSYHRANSRINLWVGAVRAGKTVGSSFRWLRHIKEGPAGPLLMVGKTERTLRRNVIDPWLYDYGLDDSIHQVIGDGYIEVDGRKVYLVGANDARAETKIRGMTLAGAYGDEVSTWPEGFFPMLLTRMSIEEAAFYGTTNPDGPFHPLKRDYIDRADELDMTVFEMGLDDNPFLPDAYKAAVTAEMKAAGPMYYQRYILGLWVAAEGAIYGLDPDGPVVIDAVPDGVTIIDAAIAVDYGTTNPTVFLYLALGDDGIIYVLGEYRWDSSEELRKKTDLEYSEDFREWRLQFPFWDDIPVVVDPSAASFITQLHRDGVRRIRRANNAVLDGIRLTASLLGSDRLRILRDCEGLIREMTSYVWDAKAAEKGEDSPVKKDDHGPDALRYGLMRTRSWWRDWITFDPEGEDGEDVAEND